MGPSPDPARQHPIESHNLVQLLRRRFSEILKLNVAPPRYQEILTISSSATDSVAHCLDAVVQVLGQPLHAIQSAAAAVISTMRLAEGARCSPVFAEEKIGSTSWPSRSWSNRISACRNG
jgi:hypothetical protein